jgi:hypothetical protein
LVENPEGKRPFGRHKRRWNVNVKIDLKEIAWNPVGRIHVAQDRDRWLTLVNTAMNIRIL